MLIVLLKNKMKQKKWKEQKRNENIQEKPKKPLSVYSQKLQ